MAEPSDWVRPPLPYLPGLLGPVVAQAFAELEIGVSLWISEAWWQLVHKAPSVSSFEHEFGRGPQRAAYNVRCLHRARTERRIIVGQHAGFRDLFVPVDDSGTMRVLVAGPFAVTRPTSTEVMTRWYELSGSQGRLADAPFSRYLSATLATLTLEGASQSSFEQLLSCFVNLVVGRGDTSVLAGKIAKARSDLARVRLAEQMWEMARRLVDELTVHTAAPLDHGEMNAVGLSAPPEHVLVGLLTGRQEESDAVDSLLRRDAFQRACVTLARKRGDLLVGRLGNHGVTLLSHHAGAVSRTRTSLIDIAGQIARLARRFGLQLHTGIAQAKSSESLPARYRAALWAAEKAVSQGLAVAYGESQSESSTERLWNLRNDLGKSVGERPELLSPRFDRYIEVVLAHSGYRLDAVKTHLGSGFERLAGSLLGGGFLDRKGFTDLCASVELAEEAARTVADLVASYRRLVSEIAAVQRSPVTARQDHGTQAALAFIGEHLGRAIDGGACRTRGRVCP